MVASRLIIKSAFGESYLDQPPGIEKHAI